MRAAVGWSCGVRARVLTLLPTIAHFLCMQYGWTALLYSAYKGHVHITKLLIQHGADVNHQDKVSRGEA